MRTNITIPIPISHAYYQDPIPRKDNTCDFTYPDGSYCGIHKEDHGIAEIATKELQKFEYANRETREKILRKALLLGYREKLFRTITYEKIQMEDNEADGLACREERLNQ